MWVRKPGTMHFPCFTFMIHIIYELISVVFDTFVVLSQIYASDFFLRY
jgi:hypothetical protein